MLVLGRHVPLGPDPPPALRLRNFHAPEDGFAWSSGRWCEVLFDLDLGRGGGRGRGGASGTVVLVLDLDVFRWPPIFVGQNVLTYLNGLRVHSAYVTARTSISAELRAAALRPRDNLLTLDVPDAIRPSEFGLEDGRTLGVQLFSIGIEAAE